MEEYRDRIKKEQSLSAIASHFKTNVKEISRKIHNLRSQYTNERTKQRKRAESGAAGTASQKKWQHFDSLDFLRDTTETRLSKSNITNVSFPLHSYIQ